VRGLRLAPLTQEGLEHIFSAFRRCAPTLLLIILHYGHN